MRLTWLRSEAKRFWAATFIALALQTPMLLIDLTRFGIGPQIVAWVALLVYASLFALVHAGLSLLAYRSLASDELRTAVIGGLHERGLIGRLLRTPGIRSLLGFSEAPSFGRQLAVIALLAVLVMLIDPELRAIGLLRVLAIVLVMASWVNLIVTYAVHYARLHAQADAGLQFPGRERRTLADYVYFASSAQTTFGSSDVAVTTTQMRKAVTAHGILAFIFNAVILALSLSLLLSS